MRMALNDPETCSWCTQEVENDALVTIDGGDGARICPRCANEVVAAGDGLVIEFSLISDTDSFFR